MSTLVDFTPATNALFSFQATLSDGNQYNISTPWNLFGQRYYVQVTDLFGNLIVLRALVSAGPQIVSSFSWADGVTTAVTSSAHNVPVGHAVNINVSQTGTALDGNFQGLSTGNSSLTYPLMTNPNTQTPLTGSVNFPLNLVAGALDAWLAFHYNSQQFEF